MDTNKLTLHIIGLEEKVDTMMGLFLISSKEVLTLKEVCLYTGYQPSTIYHYIKEAGLKSYCPEGKKIFIKREDLVEWLLRNKNL